MIPLEFTVYVHTCIRFGTSVQQYISFRPQKQCFDYRNKFLSNQHPRDPFEFGIILKSNWTEISMYNYIISMYNGLWYKETFDEKWVESSSFIFFFFDSINSNICKFLPTSRQFIFTLPAVKQKIIWFKILNHSVLNYRGVFRTLSNSNLFWPLTIFERSLFVDVWQGSNQAFE